jgi:hypothetical protein
MAVGMKKTNHEPNAQKCWDRFFREFGSLPTPTKLVWALRYIELLGCNEIPAQHRDAMRPDRDAIVSYVRKESRHMGQSAEVILFPERLARLPTHVAHVWGFESDGSVVVRSPRDMVVVPATAAPSGLQRGQRVHFVNDPQTGRARIVKAESP